ncbi:hypothetical protein GC194_15560 [bacterium]|nr:hypothetical protein [bacterium]
MGQNPLVLVLKFGNRHLRLLTLVFFGTLVLVYLVMRIFITPEYLSQTIIYPANIHPASSEDPTEQVMQVLQSSDIQNKMIDSFNLIEHYGFSTESINYKNLSKKYNHKIRAERTPLSSIEINVRDKDPVLAANMANALIQLLDRKILHMRRLKYREWAATAQEKYMEKQADINKIEEELSHLKTENKIINLEEQSTTVATKVSRIENTLAEASIKIEAFKKYNTAQARDSVRKYEVQQQAAEKKYEGLQTQFANILNVGDRIKGLEQSLELEHETLAEYKMEWEEAKQNATRKITYSFIVSQAGVADQPYYPKKVLTSLVTAVSVCFLLILFLAFAEQYEKIKSELQ